VQQGPVAPAPKPVIANTQPATSTSGPATRPDNPDETPADRTYARGIALQAADDLVGARQALSEALAGKGLSTALAADCRTRLQDIAAKVVFGRQVIPGDPYAYRYVVKPGDVLVNVVRGENVLVPAEGIMLINGIKDARRIQIGQAIKMVRGPFDAIVTKHSFTLDLYQQGMFVKSYTVGIGQNGSTPEGTFIVAPGGRVRHAPWAPPPSSGQSESILWGQPGYPLGKEGLWIALRGTDANTETLAGYGIHGTDEPESIGKQGSLGCIRMADGDIEEVFGFLLDGQSKVEVRP
jgi:hypothetical protein